MKKWTLGLLLLAGSVCFGSPVAAREPGWSGSIIAFGQEREQIEATPIIYRSYRPFHFYGNTVRRRHYRGTTVPRPADVVRGSAAIVQPE